MNLILSNLKIGQTRIVTAKDGIELPDVEAGDIWEFQEGPNPHKKGAKETVYITVISPDRHDTGFYYFYGKGKPENGKGGLGSVNHSNMFVWGIESAKKVGSAKFKTGKYKEFTWTDTGIEDIDDQMSNLGSKYQAFAKYAPKWAKAKYDRQEDKNYHHENRLMVSRFLAWVGKGNKPEDFPKK